MEASTVLRFLRVFKTAHCKVDDFRKGRDRQSDHEFLSDCGLESETEAASIAIAVRRAVAGIGLVDPLFVRAEDSYPGKLELLPLWDSMDWLALGFEIERELGHKLRWQSDELISQPCSPLTVRGLIAYVNGLLVKAQNAELDDKSDQSRNTGTT